MKADFTSSEVARLAGFKKRWMLEHLEREGTFEREKKEDRTPGRRRKYTFGDLIILRAINRMLELGARPARIRDAILQIRDVEGFPRTRRAAVAAGRELGNRLIVTQDSAYWITRDDQLLDLASKGQLAFGFMISIRDVVQEVCDIVDLYLPKRTGKFAADESVLEGLCVARGI